MIDETVVLVNRRGEAIGQHPKDSVHTTATPLHLAFSLYLFDAAGRTLLTRRALTKRTWPGVWTNSCCGHPGVGEDLENAVRRRLVDELGLHVGALTCVLPDFAYEARDAGGIQENEVCPVFAGRLLHPARPLRPNGSEVMDWAWTEWEQLVTAVAATPFAFSPWAVEQIRQLPASPCP